MKLDMKILTLVLLLCGLVLTGCVEEEEEEDEEVILPGGVVEYEVSGSPCIADIVYLDSAGAVVEVPDQDLVWTHTFSIHEGERAVFNLYVSGRNDCDDAESTITATVYVDDAILGSSTGNAEYAWASAAGTY